MNEWPKQIRCVHQKVPEEQALLMDMVVIPGQNLWNLFMNSTLGVCCPFWQKTKKIRLFQP